jgi:preprotein translocase subunit SecE
MAKEKVQEQKQSKVLQVLKTEYRFEGVLLGVLGLLVIVLGVYLIQGKLTIKWTDFWLFDSSLKRLIFAIVVTVIGAIAFLMSVYPFFIPSWEERKKITWPKRDTIINHSARVYGFIIFVILFFILVDWPLRELFAWLNS